MDMRFYWLRDRVRQNQIYVFWKNGYLNLADYVTKHHPTQHHRTMRPTYLANATVQNRQQACNSPPATNPKRQLPFQRRLQTNTALQGCVDILRDRSTKHKYNIPVQSTRSNHRPLLQRKLNKHHLGAEMHNENMQQRTAVKQQICAPKILHDYIT